MPDFHFYDGNSGDSITTESFDTLEQAVEHFTPMPNRSYMLTDTAYRAAQELLRKGKDQDHYYALAIGAEPVLIDMGVHRDTTAQELYENEDDLGALEVFNLAAAREVFNVA